MVLGKLQADSTEWSAIEAESRLSGASKRASQQGAEAVQPSCFHLLPGGEPMKETRKAMMRKSVYDMDSVLHLEAETWQES